MWITQLLLLAALGGMPPVGGPDDNKLSFFAGKWKASVRMIGPGATPASTAAGEATYRWDVGRRWLLYESRFDLPGVGPYEVNGSVGYDEESKRYRAWAFNSLGVVIEYWGAWEDDVTLVFTSTTNTGRVVYTRQPDGSVRLVSDRQRGDGTFETFFESVMTRR